MEPTWRDRWAAAPAWAYFVVLAIVWAAITLVTTPSDRNVSVIVGAVIYGGGMAAFYRWRRNRVERSTGSAMTPSTMHALRTGEAPADTANDAGLRRLAERRARQIRRFPPWVGVLEFGAFTALGIYLGITESAGWFVVAVLFAAMAAWYPVSWKRSRARTDHLTSQIDGRDGARSGYL